MNRMLLASAAALVAVSAAPANAAQFLTISGPSGTYGDDSVLTGPFTRTFNFTASQVAGFDIQSITFTHVFSSAATALNISSVLLNGVALPLTNSSDGGTGGSTFGQLFNRPILANNTITVTGNSGGDGAFSGTLAFRAVQTAVPEPGTWALMLVGFGVVGYSMRRRRVGYVSAI